MARTPPLSPWLKLLLDEIDRKHAEDDAAGDERARRGALEQREGGGADAAKSSDSDP